MTWIDTHTHADYYKTLEEQDACVKRALEAGVTKMIVPGVEPENTEAVKAICLRHPKHCFPCIGLHPSDVKANYKEKLSQIETSLRSGEVSYFGIGETGMDLYWDKTFEWEQIEAFRFHIEWALEFDLPLILHVRNAFEPAWHILQDYRENSLRGVFHCFSGSIEQAERLIKMGFYIGIGGVLTFKNSGLSSVVEAVPLESILLETDAPFLAPMPYRGKQNESSYLPLIAEKMALLKNISIEETSRITCANAEKLFFQKNLLSL